MEKSFFNLAYENKLLVNNGIVSYTFYLSQKQEALIMKRFVLTLAIALGLALGSFAITSSDVLACNGKDKGTTTEDTTGTSDSTES